MDAGAQPPRDILQLADHDPEAQHDQTGARRDSTRKDQGIAKTEFLNRDSKTDRQQTGQQTADPDDQHHNHHQTHPRAAPEMLAGPRRHDTVILHTSPTSNCEGSSRQKAVRAESSYTIQDLILVQSFVPAARKRPGR